MSRKLRTSNLARLETCSDNCQQGLRADRANGLIYGPYSDGTKDANGKPNFISSHRFAMLTGICTYCSSTIPQMHIHRLKEVIGA